MNPERNGNNGESWTAGAKMLGASNRDMLDWEKNRQKYNPDPIVEKPKAAEQPDIRDMYKRQKSAYHRLLRGIGLEN